MARRKTSKINKGEQNGTGKRYALELAVLLLLSLVLSACGAEPTATLAPATPAPVLQVNPAETLPVTGRTVTAAPTVTSDVARVFDPPTPTPPPLFPTNTALPASSAPNFTATAAVPDLNLTPVATMPTGQLAFVQAGNLWLIDNTGANRKQLTESGDIATDSLIEWTPNFDRVTYLARNGELWMVDTLGKRSLVFSPGKTARLGNAANLPLLPTLPAGGNATNPNRAPVNPAIQPGRFLTDLNWSRDGRYLSFTYYSGEVGPLASGEVWLAEIIGDKAGLTRVGEGFSPTWSPDSRTLAFVTRGSVKQGLPPAPAATPVPVGTSLLPPTVSFTRASEGQNGLLQEQQTTPGPGQTTPAVTSGTTVRNTQGGSTGATPTPFILRPGGNTPNPTGNNSSIPATPTPTLNLVALPSPTPTPTYPPVYTGTYQTNQLAIYSVGERKISALLESDKLPDAYIDLTNTLRSHVPAPFQSAWFSPDGRFVAFSDRFSVVGVIPLGGGNPVIWTGSPKNYAVYDLEWLPRSDGAFVRFGNPYTTEFSRLSLLTFNNPLGGGISGDVTNPKMVRISELPGQKVSCTNISPGGNFFSYFDGNILVITRSDGSVYKSFPDTECPGWSPLGRDFATINKNGSRSIVLTNLDQNQPHTIISTRAIERVFWLR
jgi:hypothetical protein